MDFDEFKSTLMDLVSKEVEDRGLEDIALKLTTVDSPDGMTERLMVSVGESKMSMAFRLKEIYRDVENGEDIDHAVFKIVNTIEDNISVVKTKEADVKSFVTDYDKVKDHTYLRMIPGDSPVLKDTPHKMIEDMALVVNIHLETFSDDNGKSVVVVSKPLMEMYGIDEAQLFADAEKNSLANEPLVLTPLGDMIKHLIEAEELPSPEDVGIVTYIATNKSGFQGAAVAAYPDFCEKAAETLGGSFYMLPSSVHEFILIKDDGTPKAKDLNKMVKNVNETVLEARDFLSDQCYHYDAKTKVLETGLKYAQKIQQKKGGVR
ncbi:MAG: hypothetical protein IKW88_00915 [Clostridiales bacterium]|nr:hypothetical protein [Clostridiales bacterium]